MTPQLFTGKNVIIQGITGKNGRFHAQNMLNYKTHIVAGTSPNQAVSEVHGIPVFRTISDIKKRFAIDISVIFVPAPYAKAAILEAIQAQIPLIICITEGVPVHDMLEIKQKLRRSHSVLIGPNCPGVLLPDGQLLGIIPASLAAPGDTAIVSRSGTLTYEAMSLLTQAGFGQRYIIGIGGDMISGSSFVDCLQLFQNDPSVKRIVMIGEIGGISEITAADYIKQSISKPVYAYIAGHSAPNGVQMGHAGAILGTNALESATAKTAYLQQAGAITANSISELVQKIK
ncbi:succinate--CoA ligase subunit alpha [Candidatus Nanosynsacchari sp. TM7_ANC_38.39_G1_1]|uniref:succinate--CoA ligase subunit alpha n=1 Tax=Candidatus Nanosynsacchari sp. TM7_ANC_38.39_G1_1 TaxID=1986206 RepID=UPI00101CBF5C|nr:succinate--CoA ligase subunit alpha [Candidatus Nanosynsacchari sp. TM7_ANC_38.39_G1_1]RYC73035.1 Succinate--CoA ligase [ADP-forming] subunit alpha [Candidatus Nanosynsacchari sp. TM7_ANC_38.39_G1_1]